MDCGKYFDFINSRDIRDYLREQAYELNALQCAYLVWQSTRHSLEEKHEAWQEIINTMPDVPVPTRFTVHDSLHRMLLGYMAMEKKCLALLRKSEPNAMFTYAWREEGDWFDSRYFFTQDYQSCFDHAIGDCRAYGDRMRITKQYFNMIDCRGNLVAEFDPEGRVWQIDVTLPCESDDTKPECPCLTDEERDLLREFFDELWFDIPIPFHKGDIVCGVGGWNEKPFVLEHTVPWFRREKGIDRTDGDESDMLSGGVCYDEEENSLYGYDGPYYLDLEYYHGELKSGEKMIEAYSQYVHGELSAFKMAMLLRLYGAEAAAESERKGQAWILQEIDYLREYRERMEALRHASPEGD